MFGLKYLFSELFRHDSSSKFFKKCNICGQSILSIRKYKNSTSNVSRNHKKKRKKNLEKLLALKY